ncbi:hypothetical protein [Amycolatopsis magusensis]|uniref:hypothetical protein n=1 Tax=Amycolatopsis magusensis TaxID=882444 RepID=UPI0037B1AB89
MKDTRVQRTILYTVSGGFISVVFGVLGATAAQAGPKMPTDAGGGGKAVSAAPPSKTPPGGTPQQQQKELRDVKAEANKPAAQEKKSAPEKSSKQNSPPEKKGAAKEKGNDKGNDKAAVQASSQGSGDKKGAVAAETSAGDKSSLKTDKAAGENAGKGGDKAAVQASSQGSGDKKGAVAAETSAGDKSSLKTDKAAGENAGKGGDKAAVQAFSQGSSGDGDHKKIAAAQGPEKTRSGEAKSDALKSADGQATLRAAGKKLGASQDKGKGNDKGIVQPSLPGQKDGRPEVSRVDVRSGDVKPEALKPAGDKSSLKNSTAARQLGTSQDKGAKGKAAVPVSAELLKKQLPAEQSGPAGKLRDVARSEVRSGEVKLEALRSVGGKPGPADPLHQQASARADAPVVRPEVKSGEVKPEDLKSLNGKPVVTTGVGSPDVATAPPAPAPVVRDAATDLVGSKSGEKPGTAVDPALALALRTTTGTGTGPRPAGTGTAGSPAHGSPVRRHAAPPPSEPTPPGGDPSWGEQVLETGKAAAALIPPAAHAVGTAMVHNPADVAAIIGGGAMVAAGATGVAAGSLATATGVGAPVGVPVAGGSALLTGAGATLAGVGIADLAAKSMEEFERANPPVVAQPAEAPFVQSPTPVLPTLPAPDVPVLPVPGAPALPVPGAPALPIPEAPAVAPESPLIIPPDKAPGQVPEPPAPDRRPPAPVPLPFGTPDDDPEDAPEQPRGPEVAPPADAPSPPTAPSPNFDPEVPEVAPPDRPVPQTPLTLPVPLPPFGLPMDSADGPPPGSSDESPSGTGADPDEAGDSESGDNPDADSSQEVDAGSEEPGQGQLGTVDSVNPYGVRRDWPADPTTGNQLTRRDFKMLGWSTESVRNFMSGAAPMGMTPEEYNEWAQSLQEALGRDGITPEDYDARLLGSSTLGFSGPHKPLWSDEELASRPRALTRVREWLDDEPGRLVNRPFDSGYHFGVGKVRGGEPSDYDTNISGDKLVERAREYYDSLPKEERPGSFFSGTHEYVNKDIAEQVFPNLARWAEEWTERLGREVSHAVFPSTGPKFDPNFNTHFRDDVDWIVHRPGGA